MRRLPGVPDRIVSRSYSMPLRPWSSVPTEPSTCAAVSVRGYSRRSLGRQRDAGELELADRVGLGRGQLAGEVDEAGVAAGELLDELGRRACPSSGARRSAALTGSLTRYGVADDVVGGLGDRELDAVAVGDRAAPRGDDLGGDLLGGGGLGERVALDRADVQRAREARCRGRRGRPRRGARCGGRAAAWPSPARRWWRRSAAGERAARGPVGGRRPGRGRPSRPAPRPAAPRRRRWRRRRLRGAPGGAERRSASRSCRGRSCPRRRRSRRRVAVPCAGAAVAPAARRSGGAAGSGAPAGSGVPVTMPPARSPRSCSRPAAG